MPGFMVGLIQHFQQFVQQYICSMYSRTHEREPPSE